MDILWAFFFAFISVGCVWGMVLSETKRLNVHTDRFNKFLHFALNCQLLILFFVAFAGIWSYASGYKIYHYILEIEKPPEVLAEEAMQPGEPELRKQEHEQFRLLEKTRKRMLAVIGDNEGEEELSKATAEFLKQSEKFNDVCNDLKKFNKE
jgi:hypothetical protein